MRNMQLVHALLVPVACPSCCQRMSHAEGLLAESHLMCWVLLRWMLPQWSPAQASLPLLAAWECPQALRALQCWCAQGGQLMMLLPVLLLLMLKVKQAHHLPKLAAQLHQNNSVHLNSRSHWPLTAKHQG